MAWTTPQDVLDRWIGSDAPTNTAQISALIEDAEIVIKSEYPAIQTRIDSGKLSLATVKFVVSRMVSRILRNPEGLSYLQQQTGPFGQARNYGNAGVDIWLTDDEEELLAPRRQDKAFEIDLAPNAGIHPIIRIPEVILTQMETAGEPKEVNLD